jgi:hypothetical protein
MRGPLVDRVQRAASPADITGMITGLQAHAWLGCRQLDSDAVQETADALKAVFDRVKQRYESIRDDSDDSAELGDFLESLRQLAELEKNEKS